MRGTDVLLGNHIAQINNQYTFAGVLTEFQEELFKNCNAKTQRSYCSAYKNHILPLLEGKIMDDLTLPDYENIIQQISQKKHFEFSTLMHYRSLIRRVVRCAVQKNICKDVLFGSIFSLPEDDKNDNVVQFVKNRKSLSIKEEFLLFQRIMQDPEQEGCIMGLALMYALGLRNNEACGLTFSSIREMKDYPGVFCAWVIVSTSGRSHKTKAGGKTSNAPRKIPIPAALLHLIQQRKQYLQRLIDQGELILPDGKSVEILPIACEQDFLTHCSSEKLTAIGRLILKEIQINEDQLAYIDRDLQDDNVMLEMGVTEKDPTAYLLRRNFATHLNILHLSEPEIQYIMGHNMEDSYANRYDYSSDDRLFLIAQKMEKRPIFNPYDRIQSVQPLNESQPHTSCLDTTSCKLQVDPSETATLHLLINTAEPSGTFTVSITDSTGQAKQAACTPFPVKKDASRTVNILQAYHAAYKKCKRQGNDNQ